MRLVRQRLGDQQAALHAARQSHDLAVLLVPQGQLLEHLLDVGRIGRLAEQAAAEGDGVPHRLEGIRRQFLRHEADHRPHAAVVAPDVAAVDRHAPGRRVHDAAHDRDQRRLAGTVGPEQREDLAAADLQVDMLQCLEARGIGLRQVFNCDDCCHAGGIGRRGLRCKVRVRQMWGAPSDFPVRSSGGRHGCGRPQQASLLSSPSARRARRCESWRTRWVK